MRIVNANGVKASAFFLRELITAAGGSISVERFMQEALYHPAHGYYSQVVRTVGRSGDFSTTATLHGALGQAIAAWAAAYRREVQSTGKWHLVELGGGNGGMAVEILRALGWWARRGLEYHLVEISAGLRVEQAKRLGDAGRVVLWHDDIISALSASGGRALIFSNEFVDAFPCVQLVWDANSGRWREVQIAWPAAADHPTEILVEWNGPGPNFAEGTIAPGQRVEVHRAYRRWLGDWLPSWQAGRMLTIDYGDQPPALYHRRPRGTLRAYCRHIRFEGPEIYERFGQQDITSDVNFGDLQAWSGELGLEKGTVSTQAEFLQRWMPRRWTNAASRGPVLDRLVDPEGAGGAFKVLAQTRS